MGRVTHRTRVTVVDVSADDAGVRTRADTVTVEEPLELRVNGTPLTVTMRTPGSDIELVHGFLLSEGIIRDVSDVTLARYCEGAVVSGESGFEENTYNVIDVMLAPDVAPPSDEMARNFFTSSSCGVCGKASIEQLRARTSWPVRDDPTRWPAALIATLPDKLRTEQRSFEKTGGLHAAGLYGPGGEVLVVREDVGRHNAVDKVLGWALLAERLPAGGCVLMVSGRASFELTQKALMAGIPVLAAVSAPSSLAVDLASQSGLTLVAFLRGDSMNVYTRPDRVTH